MDTDTLIKSIATQGLESLVDLISFLVLRGEEVSSFEKECKIENIQLKRKNHLIFIKEGYSGFFIVSAAGVILRVKGKNLN